MIDQGRIRTTLSMISVTGTANQEIPFGIRRCPCRLGRKSFRRYYLRRVGRIQTIYRYLQRSSHASRIQRDSTDCCGDILCPVHCIADQPVVERPVDIDTVQHGSAFCIESEEISTDIPGEKKAALGWDQACQHLRVRLVLPEDAPGFAVQSRDLPLRLLFEPYEDSSAVVVIHSSFFRCRRSLLGSRSRFRFGVVRAPVDHADVKRANFGLISRTVKLRAPPKPGQVNVRVSGSGPLLRMVVPGVWKITAFVFRSIPVTNPVLSATATMSFPWRERYRVGGELVYQSWSSFAVIW